MNASDLNRSTFEAFLLSDARRIKVANNSTRVFVYRNAFQALQWAETARAVMYSPAHAGFFLRCRDGRIWHRGRKPDSGSCGPGVPLQKEGDLFFWDFTNSSAAAEGGKKRRSL